MPAQSENHVISTPPSVPRVYQQLYEQLAKGIQNGAYPAGERLPSERNLCERFGVSRTTVRQALRKLEQNGLVQSRRGSGTFVNAPASGEQQRLLGLIVPDLRWNFYGDIINTATNAAVDSGTGLLLGVHNENVDCFIRTLQTFCRKGVAVNLLILPRSLGGEHLQSLIQCTSPYVLLMRDHPQLTCSKVILDNPHIGAEATRLLLKRGCRKPIYVGPLDYLTAWNRLRGYRQALAEAGLVYNPEDVVDTSVVPAQHQSDYAIEAVARLLQQGQAFDGVVAFNDGLAYRITNMLKQQGLQVPHSVSVVGVDDRPEAIMCSVPLTTLRFNGTAAAHLAIQAALRLQSGRLDSAVSYIPVEVVHRASCPAAESSLAVQPG